MIDYLNFFCPCGIQEALKNNKNVIQCTSCHKYQHKFCMKSMVKMPGYQCPYCQFKKGALFFNILYSLVDPYLIEFNPINRITHIWISFIPDTLVYSTFQKKCEDSPMAIVIRCLRFDKNGFSFHWPKMSKIYINDKIILDLTRKGSKQRDRMIALVPSKDYDKGNIQKKFFLYDSNIIKNEEYLIEKKPNRFEIDININEDEKMEYKNFMVSIDLCEIYKEPEPIMSNIPILNSKKEILNLLINNEGEKSLYSIKEKVRLMDIYTETEKIKIPARGINCCHLNVFDLKTFLVINRKTNKFQCPYCKRYSNDLYIDGIIYDFLKNPENDIYDEIYIDKDFNILTNDNQTENNVEPHSSNSNDDTCKTEINKSYGKSKHKTSNSNINRHPNLIRIVEDESDKDNSDYDNLHISSNFNNSDNNHVNENDFNNNNCNIISDLGQMFDQIREDILSDKKKRSSEETKISNFTRSKSLKRSSINLGMKDYDYNEINSKLNYGIDLSIDKYRHSRRSLDNISKKRKRSKNAWIDELIESCEN